MQLNAEDLGPEQALKALRLPGALHGHEKIPRRLGEFRCLPARQEGPQGIVLESATHLIQR